MVFARAESLRDGLVCRGHLSNAACLKSDAGLLVLYAMCWLKCGGGGTLSAVLWPQLVIPSVGDRVKIVIYLLRQKVDGLLRSIVCSIERF